MKRRRIVGSWKYVCVVMFMSLLNVTKAAAAQQPDRSAPPTIGGAPSLKLPALQQSTLANGLHVILMEKRDVPLVQVALLVRAGSALDPDNRLGLADMVAAMLDEGAGDRSALDLSEAIDFLGAELSVSAGFHTTTIALHTPRSRFDEALTLMADVVLRPTFAEEEIERERRSRLTTLLQWHDEPRAISGALFSKVLFGAEHPYGRSSLGDERSIRAIATSDLRGFHQRFFRPNNAALIVVGDVALGDVRPKLEAAFGSWSKANVPSTGWPEVEQVQRRTVYLVDKPEAAQSEIMFGRIGVRRATEDYYAIVVMNTILGGSFASRLNQNLREDKGYTYGARSGFAFRAHRGPFIASASVQTDVTDKALVEFVKELRGILDPVSDDELTRAKNFVALRFPGQFQSVAQIADRLAELAEFGLPPEYFNQFVERILAVTKEDVQRVARTYLDPDRMAIVVVGDRARIEEGIRAVDLGPIELLTVRDVLGEPPVVESS